MRLSVFQRAIWMLIGILLLAAAPAQGTPPPPTPITDPLAACGKGEWVECVLNIVLEYGLLGLLVLLLVGLLILLILKPNWELAEERIREFWKQLWPKPHQHSPEEVATFEEEYLI